MKLTKILGAQSGIQSSGVKNNSGADTTVQLLNAIIFGQFKRGRFDRPFKVTLENIRAKLGYEPDNKDYRAVEDTLKMGIAYIWVQRLKGSTLSVEPVPPPKDEKTLEPFDYAVIRYFWTTSDGLDLDTRTAVEQPERNINVGWGAENEDQNYLIWSADNIKAGYESVLINMHRLLEDYPQRQNFKINCRAFWFGEVLQGNLKIVLETYQGGLMEQNDFNFINKGGRQVQSLTLTTKTYLLSRLNIEGELLAYITFDRQTNTGKLTKVSNSYIGVNNLTAENFMSKINLNWTNLSSAMTDQWVERDLGDGSGFYDPALTITKGTGSNYSAVDNDVVFDKPTTLKYRIMTAGPNGEELSGNIVSVTVQPSLAAVTDLKAVLVE